MHRKDIHSQMKGIKTKTTLIISGLGLGAAGLLMALAAPLAANAAVGGPTCNVPADYSTIQDAVNVSACSTINVAAGTYSENVSINRTLTLNGARAGLDARTRSGSESIINGGFAANITITADNVTVDGFTLNGPSSSGTAAIVMQNANTGETIQNNIVNNPGRAASITTSNTVFRKNVVNNSATSSDGFQANTTPVHDLAIADNNFSGADPNFYNADITVIEGNSNVVVSGNSSRGDGTLVALFKTNGAQISRNKVVGGGGSSAIYIGGGDSNVTVSRNEVSSAGSAVKVANDFGIGPNSSVTIWKNNLHNNTTGVKIGATAVAVANTVVANRNSLTQNTDFGVNNLSSFNADATCNWWGTARGPGPVGPGTGDKVSTGVTFSPWLRTSNLNGHCGNNKDDHDNNGRNDGGENENDND